MPFLKFIVLPVEAGCKGTVGFFDFARFSKNKFRSLQVKSGNRTNLARDANSSKIYQKLVVCGVPWSV